MELVPSTTHPKSRRGEHARWPALPSDPRGTGASPQPQRPVPYTEAPRALLHKWQTMSMKTPSSYPRPPPHMITAASPTTSAPVVRRPTESTAARLARLSPPAPPRAGAKPPSTPPPSERDGTLSTAHTDMVLQRWGSGGIDFTSPSGMLRLGSAYSKLKQETASGTYMSSWGRMPVGEVYVPPWERTSTRRGHVDRTQTPQPSARQS